MPVISLLLNVLWIVFGGFYMAAGWVLAALIMVITIVGIPWARAALTIAFYTLLPFGQTVVAGRPALAAARSAFSAISFGCCWPAGGSRSAI